MLYQTHCICLRAATSCWSYSSTLCLLAPAPRLPVKTKFTSRKAFTFVCTPLAQCQDCQQMAGLLHDLHKNDLLSKNDYFLACLIPSTFLWVYCQCKVTMNKYVLAYNMDRTDTISKYPILLPRWGFLLTTELIFLWGFIPASLVIQINHLVL